MNSKMQNTPLISIITVCFNSAKNIRQTIESVLNQTYTNIEYILVDGKSTDNTFEIIKEYESKFAEKGIIYHWISEPDNGIYDAMNKGVKMATGEWINFQGSDDWLELNACEEISKTISSCEILPSLIYSITKCYTQGIPIGLEQIYHDQLRLRTTCHQAIFYKKELHQRHGFYNTSYKICSDYEFLLKCYLAQEFFLPINVLIANFSLNGTNDKLHHITMKEMVNIKFKYGLASKKHILLVNFKSIIFQILRKFNLSV